MLQLGLLPVTRTPTTTTTSTKTAISQDKVMVTSPTASAFATEPQTSASDLIKQLQCLLNATMNAPAVVNAFMADPELRIAAEAWNTLPVDGVLKYGTSWLGRRESDTLALLSRTGIPQFWLGEAPNFGPDYVAAHVGAYVTALTQYIRGFDSRTTGACDFPAQTAKAAAAAAYAAAQAAAERAAQAAAQQAAADQAAADAEARAQWEADLVAQAQAQAAQTTPQQAQATTQAQQSQASPSMQVTEAPPPMMMPLPPSAPPMTMTPKTRNGLLWLAGAAIGGGVLVALLRR